MTDQPVALWPDSIHARNPQRLDHPVVIAVPHAGRAWPAALAERVRLSPAQMIRLEDRHADQLAEAAAARGFAVFCATVPRAVIDLNRAEADYDPALLTDPPPGMPAPSARVRGGLGLVPARLAGAGDIWRARMPQAELLARIAALHRPWHSMLAAALATRQRRHGAALLIDLHSMPPLPPRHGQPPARIVIGDGYGRSAGRRLVQIALEQARAAGWAAAHNAPYAGGHTLERHGAPARGLHALQLEIDRGLYLDAALDQPSAAVAAVATFVAALAERLSAELTRDSRFLQAAE